MCPMNERKWAEIYDERLRDAALLRQRHVWDDGVAEEEPEPVQARS